MIIQLRGTSGSGKTTAMRKIIGNLAEWEPVYLLPGRRKPSYYFKDGVSALGHYDSPCGGCDTFKGYGQIQAVVREASSRGNVIMEGLMLSDDVKQTTIIHETVAPVIVFYLITDIELCIERVKQRRAAKGKDDVFNEAKLRNRAEQIDRTRIRLIDAGVDCRRCSADQAPKLVLKMLGR